MDRAWGRAKAVISDISDEGGELETELYSAEQKSKAKLRSQTTIDSMIFMQLRFVANG